MINLKGSFESARFEAELVPHRSLTPNGVKAVLSVSALTTLPPAIGFGLLGYWPITLMLLLAEGGLYMGLRANVKEAEERQFLVMNDEGLTMTHTHPNWKNPVVHKIPVPPHARVEEHEVRGLTKLSLRLFGKSFPLGHFLPIEETKNLKQNLRVALRNWTKDSTSIPS